MARQIAITRDVSPSIGACELTHLPRRPIDVERAKAQHRTYEQALEELGCTIVHLPAGEDMPDAVFVEDTAIVVDEIAIIARPGAASRRAETAAVASALSGYRRLTHIVEPGTLEGAMCWWSAGLFSWDERAAPTMPASIS